MVWSFLGAYHLECVNVPSLQSIVYKRWFNSNSIVPYLPEKITDTSNPIWPIFSLVQDRAAFPHLRVRKIVTRNDQISAAWLVFISFCFLFWFFFSILFWHPDRTFLSRHHHPYPLSLSVLPLFHPIRFCTGGSCWRLWVVRAFNGLSLFCRHVCSFPVGVKIFYNRGCLVGIGFGDFFQFKILLTTLSLG